MTTKLTLSLNKSVIERAKKYAKQSNQSLSQIIESYLDKITSEDFADGDAELNSIRGIISLPEDWDYKNEVRKIKAERNG